MSTHPNAMLLGVITPDDLTRKTYRAILDETGGTTDDPRIKIGARDYSLTVMEDSYDDGYQITAPEGSIVAHAYLTYGYGEVVTWDEAAKAKEELEEWLRGIAERHKCSYSIQLTANYW
jgi:hypothetical protein